MLRRRTTPLGAVAKGIVAGAAGTGVMTAYQLAVAKAMGSGSSYTPAEVGKRVIEGVLGHEVPEERMETLNTWSTPCTARRGDRCTGSCSRRCVCAGRGTAWRS